MSCPTRLVTSCTLWGLALRPVHLSSVLAATSKGSSLPSHASRSWLAGGAELQGLIEWVEPLTAPGAVEVGPLHIDVAQQCFDPPFVHGSLRKDPFVVRAGVQLPVKQVGELAVRQGRGHLPQDLGFPLENSPGDSSQGIQGIHPLQIVKDLAQLIEIVLTAVCCLMLLHRSVHGKNYCSQFVILSGVFLHVS